MLSQQVRKAFSKVRIQNFINGEFVDSCSEKTFKMLNPADGECTGEVPLSTSEEFKEAVEHAKVAFETWKETPIMVRQRYLFRLHSLIEQHQEEFVESMTREHGKTNSDARGDLSRGLEVLEHACSMSTITMGETQMNVSKGIDTYSFKIPLGVTTGVAPFNFPAMIPLWMFPIALATGNTFILKPSERTPSAALLMAKLTQQVNLPKGVLQMVNGDFTMTQMMCHHPDVKAVSFVGGNNAGMYIAEECAKNNKRYQCNMAAKNHCIIMPDCNPTDALNNLVNAAFGSSGQRCMALAVAVFVGDSHHMVDKVVEAAKGLKTDDGANDDTHVPPVCYKEQKDRIIQLVNTVEKEGGKVLLDGTKFIHPTKPNGYYIAPTVIEVEQHHTAYQEEIFGPVLCIVRKPTLDSAIQFVNENKWGNGASIFTKSGAVGRKFQTQIQAGQVGINVPVPVPLPMFSFTGNKQSFNGDLNFYGKASAWFYTQQKTITSRWKLDNEEEDKIQMAFPVLK